MQLFLPQDDPQPERRVKALADGRETYTYNYDYIPGAPMADKVPRQDLPSLAYIEKVTVQLLAIMVNTAKVDSALAEAEHRETALERWKHFLHTPVQEMIQQIEEGADLHRPGQELEHAARIMAEVKQGGLHYVFQQLQNKALLGKSKGRAERMADFELLFQEIPRQAIVDTYADDATFARMRTQGPNPVMLRRIDAVDDRFPVTDAMFQLTMGADDSLAAAGAEGRLFLCDYAALDGAQCGAFPDGQKFISAPLALFALPRGNGDRQLRPVAIQCQQAPGPNNPIFTPRDGHGWLIAKSIVQTADGNVHQAVSHLARSHLVLECFVLATRRQLAPNHPLRALLEPHFEGTVIINDAAQSQLMCDGGIVDALLSSKIEVSRALAAKGRADWRFNSALPRQDFADRGVDDTAVLPGYAYRDDALLLWDAIRAWVADFLGIYYQDDAAIRADGELQAWMAELLSADGGRMSDIGQNGGVETLGYLVDATTLVLFTCSCQHSAVNFPQYELMAYAVNFPLAQYRAAPTSKEGLGEQDYLDILPPLDMAHMQLDIGFLLGGIHHTQLGQYPDHLFAGYFSDQRVKDALARFQRQLEEIEQTIEERNAHRAPYQYLMPSSIPQSINI